MFLIKAKAPTRVDLAGGTIDLWPIANLLRKKATVNVGVSLFAECDISQSTSGSFLFESAEFPEPVSGSYSEIIQSGKLPLVGMLVAALWHEKLPALHIRTRSGSPAGAGLGGSSALEVAVASAIWRARQLFENVPDLNEKNLVTLLQNIESKLIHAPTGSQDYWGAVRGGVNIMSYPFSGEHIDTFDSRYFSEIDNRMILCFTGKSRASADNNWQVYKGIFEGKKDVLANMEKIGEWAWECAEAVKSKNLDKALEASRHEWQARKALWKDIETPETKTLDQAAIAAGCYFTRLCGAGGGGVMAAFCPPEAREKVKVALEANGGRILPAQIVDRGIQVACEKLKVG